MEQKVVMVAKDGQVRIGNDVIELNDCSTWSFKTTLLEEFVEFCKAHCLDVSLYEVFYGEREATCRMAYPMWEDPTRFSAALANLSMKDHLALKRLTGKVNSDRMTNGECETFLKGMRAYAGDVVNTIVPYIRDHQVNKITKIVRKVDNRGNYVYSVVKEQGGGDGFPIPEKILFTIPIFEGIEEDRITFECDLIYDWVENEKGVTELYSLESVTFADNLTHARKEIMGKYLNEIGCPLYWGSAELNTQDDSYKHMINNIVK